MAGPTTAGQVSTENWASHRSIAFGIRLSIALLPILLSIGLGLFATSTFPPERLGVNRWIWWLGLIGIAAILLRVLDAGLRRLTPLAMLYRMSLAFPDQTPSRFAVALRAGTVTKTKSRIREIQAGGGALVGDDAVSAQMLDLITLLSHHDRKTRGHAERVRSYAELIAEEMKVPAADLDRLRWGALLHDMGKLEVPAEILNKPGRPSEEEWKILSAHPAAAERHLEPISDWLGEWRHAADGHHERWDGSGYPKGLAGEDIPLAARIVAVADAYDVMTSVRSYKSAMPAEEARAEVANQAGAHFDPVVSRAFLRVGIGDLRRVAGPLAWVAGLPGFRQVPIAQLTQPVVTAVGVVIATVASTFAGFAFDPTDTTTPPSIAFADDAAESTSTTSAAPATNPTASLAASTTIDTAASPSTSTDATDDQVGSTTTSAGEATTTSAGATSSTPTTALTTTAPTTTATATPTSAPASTTPATTTTTTTTTAAPNQPPIASGGSFTTSEQSAVGTLVASLAVSDPDGDSLTVTLDPSTNPNLDADVSRAFAATHNAATSTIEITIADAGDIDVGEAGQITNLDLTISDTAGNSTSVTANITTNSRFAKSPDSGNVIITEVDWSSDGDEFVEVTNIGPNSVDISGWVIADYGFGTDAPDVTVSWWGEFAPGSTLGPGERAVMWVNGPVVTQQAAVRASAGFTGWELVRSDDIWVFDDSDALVAYMAYGDVTKQDFDNEIGDRPPIDAWNLWDPAFETTLGTGPVIKFGDSLSLTVENLSGSRNSACWEPTTSGMSVGRCGGATTSVDSNNRAGSFRSSPGTQNT